VFFYLLESVLILGPAACRIRRRASSNAARTYKKNIKIKLKIKKDPKRKEGIQQRRTFVAKKKP
jgi:hypothetical protein